MVNGLDLFDLHIADDLLEPPDFILELGLLAVLHLLLLLLPYLVSCVDLQDGTLNLQAGLWPDGNGHLSQVLYKRG